MLRLALWLFTLCICARPALARMAFMHEAGKQKRIAVSEDNGAAVRFVSDPEKMSLYPDISADGTRVVYVQGERTDSLGVVLQDLSTDKIYTLREASLGRHLHPDLSGDGRAVAFSFNNKGEGKSSIHVYSLTDDVTLEHEVVLKSDEASYYFPALNSDASFVVYQKDSLDGKQRTIVKHDFVSGKDVVISDPSKSSMSPSLSLDDQMVAFTAKDGGNWDVYVKDLGSDVVVRITDASARDFAPAFTPEGDVIYASDVSGRFELYRLSRQDFAQPQKARKLTSLDGDVYAPSVSGDVNYRQALHAPVLEPARSSFGSIAVGNRIYVVGGHQGKEHTYPPESFLANVEYLDVKTDTWHKAAPRKNPSHGFEVAAYGNKLYAFGGFAYSADHKPRWKSLDVIERYDPDSDAWTEIGVMPRRRSSYVLGQVGAKVYIFGGWDSTPKHDGDLNGVFHRQIDVFDLETETMSTSEVLLPDPLRRAFTSVVEGNKIYLIGGLGQGASHFHLLANITVFDVSTQKFEELPELPFATFAPAAAFVGGDLHVFGGMFKVSPEDYVYVNHIYRLDGAYGWRNTGRYLREGKGFARVVNKSPEEVYILGGHQYLSDGSDTPVATVESFLRPLQK